MYHYTPRRIEYSNLLQFNPLLRDRFYALASNFILIFCYSCSRRIIVRCTWQYIVVYRVRKRKCDKKSSGRMHFNPCCSLWCCDTHYIACDRKQWQWPLRVCVHTAVSPRDQSWNVHPPTNDDDTNNDENKIVCKIHCWNSKPDKSIINLLATKLKQNKKRRGKLSDRVSCPGSCDITLQVVRRSTRGLLLFASAQMCNVAKSGCERLVEQFKIYIYSSIGIHYTHSTFTLNNFMTLHTLHTWLHNFAIHIISSSGSNRIRHFSPVHRIISA